MNAGIGSVLLRAVHDAGSRFRESKTKTPAQIQRKCRESMARDLRNIDPAISFSDAPETTGKIASLCVLDSWINYSRGISTYGVMASYSEEAVPVCSTIYFPEYDELYFSEQGKGTKFDARRVSVSSLDALDRAVVCCNLDYYGPKNDPIGFDVIYKLSKNHITWRNLGSPAFEFCLLATGKIDAIVMPVHESSFSAGYLIMKEAGARVTDLRGREYTIHSQSLVAANPALHEQLIDLIE